MPEQSAVLGGRVGSRDHATTGGWTVRIVLGLALLVVAALAILYSVFLLEPMVQKDGISYT